MKYWSMFSTAGCAAVAAAMTVSHMLLKMSPNAAARSPARVKNDSIFPNSAVVSVAAAALSDSRTSQSPNLLSRGSIVV